MATKKEIRGVIVPRHDTAINWSKAVNFTPENGELIIISADNATDVARGYYLDSEGNKLTSITVNSNGVNKVCAIKPSDKVRFKFGNGKDNVNALPFQTDALQDTASGSTILIDDISPVTHEMSVKISSDTITDLTTVKVTRCGKNLIQTNIIEVTSPAGVENLIWQGHISVSGKLSFSLDNSEYTPKPSNKDSANFKFVFGDGTARYLAASGPHIYLKTPSPLKEIYFLNWGRGTGVIKNIQLEIGSSATDYEPYVEPTEYTPNADGTVNGVTSIYPNTTLMTDTEGVLIDCEYLTKLYTEVFGSANIKNESINIKNGFAVGSLRGIGAKEEDSSYTLGQYSVAEGFDTEASGDYSHAEGFSTTASGRNSHAEGAGTEASGDHSHAEGAWTVASGANSSHAEGFYTVASGRNSHAEGASTEASGEHSHAEGTWTTASGANSHAQGRYNISNTNYADVIGNGTSDTERSNAYTMDWNGNAWFAGDVYTKSTSGKNKDEGSKKLATEEYVNTKLTTNLVDGSSVGSIRTIGSKEEDSSYKLGQYSVAEGYATEASGEYSHAEGSNTEASGDKSHAEGSWTVAAGKYSHAEGIGTTASGKYSHAEGYYTTASGGEGSHAEGYYTEASGNYSHAEGRSTIASSVDSHAQGRYNISNDTYADVIGNGTSVTKRSNAYTMDWKGNAWFAGAVTSNGADYAEFFEWLDGNPNNEDRVGYLVALDGEKIRFANPGDEILGIISANPAILGDNYECNWNGKYLTDEFGRILYDKVEEFIDITKINEETGETIIEKKSLGFFDHPRINPNYNPEQEYINRRDRSEWAMVGMFGKLLVLDDGTAQLNGYVSIGEGGIATASTEKTNMRVLSRVNDHIIKVLLK